MASAVVALGLVFAALPAAVPAVRGASLVPASAEAALVLEDRGAASGLRAFLGEAGKRAPTLAPSAVGRQLRALACVDLLDEPAALGLGPGPRVLVLGRGVALSAPVANAAAARRALREWLELRGHARPLRTPGAPGLLASAERVGAVVRTRAGMRLFAGSGRGAPALIASLLSAGTARRPALQADARLAPALHEAGSAWLWLGGRGPLHGAVLSLEGTARALAARGRVIPERDAILSGAAPGPCAPAGLGCLRAALGPGGRTLLDLAARELLFRTVSGPAREALGRFAAAAVSRTGRLALRLDGLDARLLGAPDDSIWAVRWSAASDATVELPAAGEDLSRDGESLVFQGLRPLCASRMTSGVALSTPCVAPPSVTAGAGAALEGELDLGALDRALARLSPLDLVRGEIAAGAWAAHLLYGPLLKVAGPLSVSGSPARDQPEAAQLVLRLPLRP